MNNVTFVILTWNSEKVIKNCLESIYNLKETNAQVVVIDNGSKDNTVKIIESFINQTISNKELELIKSKENLGTTITRNMGIKKAKEGYNICILDSDTVINDDAINLMIDYLNKNPKCGIVGPRMKDSKGVEQTSARNFPTVTEKFLKVIPLKSIQKIANDLHTIKNTEGKIIHEADYLMSACWLLQKGLIDNVGLLDENIFYAPEDAEYCIRVWKSGYSVVYNGEANIIHEWQRISKQKFFSKMNKVHLQGLYYMFKKHNYWFSTKRLKNKF
ncbi:MAG: glycosyltransferase [Christensenellaceae bacterium]|nr:glycosyltransferase [Christensenellaceae bacterium]